jgi:1-phosphofructokinase family hexose kinase
MIHCVNLNATLDHLFVLPRLGLGDVNRAVATLTYPGGKGNNVARTVAVLGGKARLHAFCSRVEKAASLAFYRERGVDARLTAVPGRSRPCFIILDAEKNEETVINSPNQLELKDSHVDVLGQGLMKAVKAGDIVSFSGSLPEGIKDDTFRQLITAVQAKGGIALLDSYGPGLRHGVEAAPFLVKPNAEELGSTFNAAVRTREQVIKAARALLRKGVRCVVVTLGGRGAVVCTQREILYISPLPTPRGLRSPVGCGDAFLGGLAWGLERGLDLQESLRWATAAAWANLNQPGAVFFDAGLVKAQVKQVKISHLGT